MYKCSKCGLGVIVMDGETIKACNCEAVIIAEASGEVKGHGLLNGT